MSFLSSLRPYCSLLTKSITQPAERLCDGKPGGLFNLTYRTIIRVHFPRPSERKRIKRHGYEHRLKTPSGRKLLMNAILKGRYVYSH